MYTSLHYSKDSVYSKRFTHLFSAHQKGWIQSIHWKDLTRKNDSFMKQKQKE